MLEIEHEKGEVLRKVHSQGCISFQGHDYYLGEAFQGFYVTLRDGEKEGHKEVYFNNQKIEILNLREDWIK